MSRLSPEQAQAGANVLSCRDQAVVLRGAAGVGKTTVLSSIIEGSKDDVLVFAPTTKAVEVLQKDGGASRAGQALARTQTVQALLQSARLQADCRNKVVVVDEYSLLSLRQLHDLTALARRQNARLIFSGDSRQHLSVEAGDAARIVERETPVRVVDLKTIRRQVPAKYRAAVQSLADGRTAKGLKQLDALGAVVEVTDRDARLARMVDDYLSASAETKTIETRHGKKSTRKDCIMVAPTWAETPARRQHQRRTRWPCASTLGANPCNPMSGKPTVATVPPSFTVRLAAMGSGTNRSIDTNVRTPESVESKFSNGMNKMQNISLGAESPFQQGIGQSFAKHQNQSDVSHSTYRREKHLALQKELQGRTLIYLDTNHWVHLRDVILNSPNERPGYREILGLLETLIKKKRILCPVSYPLFLELMNMRQADGATRLATARLMDFYSNGVCILDDSELNRMELRRLILRVIVGDKAPDWDEWIWSKCGYLFNEDSFVNEAIPEDVPKEMKNLLLKVSVDHNWMMTFEYLAEKLIAGRPEWPGKNLTDTTIALMEQDRLAKLSFPEVFLQEKESLLRRLTGKYQEKIAREVWEAYPEHHDVDKWHRISEKGIDPHAIPSLQVVAGVNAAFAVSERKLDANDISDFQHAAVAVPYFDALFCDGGMATMLNDKPLEFGKIYNTDIISRPSEMRDYLVRLLN